MLSGLDILLISEVRSCDPLWVEYSIFSFITDEFCLAVASAMFTRWQVIAVSESITIDDNGLIKMQYIFVIIINTVVNKN